LKLLHRKHHEFVKGTFRLPIPRKGIETDAQPLKDDTVAAFRLPIPRKGIETSTAAQYF